MENEDRDLCIKCKFLDAREGQSGKKYNVCLECFQVNLVTGNKNFIAANEVRKALRELGHDNFCPWFERK